MRRPVTLILAGAAAVAAIGHAFWAPFPGPGGNPMLDLVAYHDPTLRHLDELGILGKRTRLIATEGARYGALFDNGRLREGTVILSDGAGQFNLGDDHALCWVHIDRLFREWPSLSPHTQGRIDRIRSDISAIYRKLGTHAQQPEAALRAEIEATFDNRFGRKDPHRRPRRAPRTRQRPQEQAPARPRPPGAAPPQQCPRVRYPSLRDASQGLERNPIRKRTPEP